jgi:hypothetical protein
MGAFCRGPGHQALMLRPSLLTWTAGRLIGFCTKPEVEMKGNNMKK